MIIFYFLKRYQTIVRHKYSKEMNRTIRSKVLIFIMKIFDWNANFRFSSRFMNTMVVSLITLYYVFIQTAYLLLYLIAVFNKYIPGKSSLIILLI